MSSEDVVTQHPKAAKFKILAHEMDLGETRRNVWRATPRSGVDVESLNDPTYWSHVAKRARPGDKIEAFWEDGSRYVELIVVGVGSAALSVRILSQLEIARASEEEETPSEGKGLDMRDYRIVFAGSLAKFRITRIKDRHTVKDGFDTKDAAALWLKEHLKALAA